MKPRSVSSLTCIDDSVKFRLPGWHVLSLQTAVGETLSSVDLEMSAAYIKFQIGKLDWLSMESSCVRASINDTESIYRDLNIKLYFKVYGN